MQLAIPGGPKKGTPIVQAQTTDIEYWLRRIEGDLEKDPKKKFADKDRAWVAGAKQELARRSAGGVPAAATPPATAQSTALAQRPTDTLLVGPTHDPKAVTARLQEATQHYHLVSPATSCESLPPGCGVSLTLVHTNTSEEYSVGSGKFGLSGNTLKRIGAAAGVDWDLSRSGRLDDGRDPRYVHYRAVGVVQNFDGSRRTVSGEVELDLREGSPQVESMYARAKDASKIDNQVRDMKLFLLRHAETKAKLRAIADMGVKRSYTAEELAKPFAVARLMWTGHTDDPALKREAFRMQHEAMTGATQTLYGGTPQRHSLPEFKGHPAPPVGAVTDDPEDLGTYDYEVAPEPAEPAAPVAAKEEPSMREPGEDAY